ncbi:autotransporter outer membrane beta-barrel domain-containing protein (plasmid) [Bartonella sp. HY329]|uniref:autotransporter outer membrane beta-barrel domain-containing protein n=1 Tax=unclassified Bartonella TaxID=2645622 RepID=UPI0021C81942|nr:MULTISPECIES: autotransporter outer membrane beta-barrel domain-containing protein [unclassified Bartonella]UXM96562.1 autotransporter outer membrane beta-barrel domain-containing protein [Bartonella sp. HY329]UXN10885.1 autotransporter outer membrane beta-barrel domain-containing protein [Bartonella sp. HY328]
MMNLSKNRFKFKGYVSRFALTIALGGAIMGSIGLAAATAEDISYNGNDAANYLKQDPTGNTAAAIVFKSLFANGVYSGNTITVGLNNATVVSNWNTQTDASDPVAPYVIYGGVSIGAVGNTQDNNNGTAGKDITKNTIFMQNVQYDWSGKAAPDGASIARDNGGGVGGMGGGSVYGGLTIGGAGANGGTASIVDAGMGGSGGSVANNNVILAHVTLVGASGGSGGFGVDNRALGGSGSGGVAGMGGASVYGGLSIGGSGALGGSGGSVIGNIVTLTDIRLTGGVGGNGGNGGYSARSFGIGGGGVGGMGGGSVYGGLSIGGAGGNRSGSGADGFGGGGGIVRNNYVILVNVTLDGALGGSGGGGMGGGSVYGGLSIGGGGTGGGDGGAVIGNIVTLTNVILAGNGGGAGGAGGVGIANIGFGNGGYGRGDGSGGVGGMGGGSVYGGLSIGGSGGGADGGAVTGNIVTLTDVRLTGGVGGNGGNGGYGRGSSSTWTTGGSANGDGSGGVGGIGGGSVYGGLSIGGSGGIELQNGSNSVSYGNGSGGAGGAVMDNTVTLKNVILTGALGGVGGDGGIAVSFGPRYVSIGVGGGGIGGMGGGSVYGGVSIGGSGGQDNYENGNGGSGGIVKGNNVILTNVVLNGAQGGSGGNGGLGTNVIAGNGFGYGYGGGGVGGIGGGSVFGGLSIGGSGGMGNASTYGIAGGDGGSGGDVTSNSLTLTDVVLNGAQGGSGGDAGSGNFDGAGASGNSGMAGGSVYGGLSIGGAGGKSYGVGGTGGDGGIVSNNNVGIAGISSIGASIYGGLSIGGAAGSNGVNGSGGQAINNTVTLIGDKITLNQVINGVTTYGSIWGGKSIDGAGVSFNESGADFATIFEKVISGNTLNLVGYRGTVSGVYNFENYNWTLPSDVKNGDTLITIAEGGSAVDLTDTKHTVADMKVSDNRLNDGDEVTFITKTTGTWSASPYTIKQGQFIIYEATLSQKPNGTDEAFVLTIGKKDDTTPPAPEPTPNPTPEPTPQPIDPNGSSAAKVNPQSKSYLEGRAAALAVLNQANDLISMAGIDTIRIMVRANDDDVNRPAFIPFMIANGSSQRYNTGSHVDIKGFNMALGIATGFDFYVGHKATVGAFFEYGRGTYDTYNSFSNFASVHGDGSSDYKGGGLFGRIDFANTGLGRVSNLAVDQADGVYLEASIRAGRASSKFDVGNNIFGQMENGYHGSYDSKSRYYGGHLAGGYVFNFDEKQSLDVYSRYLWVHMDGDTVSISNEKLRFDRAQSSRLQIGGRYAYAYNEQFKPYIGAAYEYEFDGEIAARAYEFNLDKPSLQGSTGIFEAGFNFQPIATNQYFNINVNAQGYVGQRQGGGGGVKIKYQF